MEEFNFSDASGEIPERKELHLHTKIQWLLLKIGILKGYDVWIAKNDFNREFNGEKLSSLCLEEIPSFTSHDILKNAQYIDAIWFQKNGIEPFNFFEVEKSTSIFSGLLRLNDIKIDYPMKKATIISSEKRKNEFIKQTKRKTFVHSGLNEICEFKTYQGIESEYEELSGSHSYK